MLTAAIGVVTCAGARGKVSRSQLADELFQKNKKSFEIDALLMPLIEAGLISQESEETRGRPRTIYTLRNKRVNGVTPLTSEGTGDLSRIPRNTAEKVYEANPQVKGHTPLNPLNPPGTAKPAPGAPTASTPGDDDTSGTGISCRANQPEGGQP